MTASDGIAAACVAGLIRTEGAAEAAESAYETVVKRAFHKAGRGSRAKRDEVAMLVSGQLSIDFPAPLVSAAVNRLLDRRELLPILTPDGNELELAADQYDYIEQRSVELQDLKRKAIDGWLDAECTRDPRLSSQREVLTRIVEDYIENVAAFFATEAEVVCGADPELRLPEPPEPSENVIMSLPHELRESGGAACRRFISEAVDERLRYILGWLDGHYELQLLRCTPEIQDLFTVQMSETVCFVDTNVLLEILEIADPQESDGLSAEAVRLASSLSVHLCVSEETRQEYLRLLDEARRQRLSAREYRPNGDEDREGNKASPFLCHYLRRLSNNRELTWSEYETEYRALPSLVRAHGIVYDPTMHVQNRASIPPVAQLFDIVWPSKKRNAREHDAALYLLVRQLRLDRGSGVKVWLLTRDHTLYAFDRVADQSLPATDLRLPSFAVRPHAWLEWLRSRAAARLTEEDYTRQFGRLLTELHFTRAERDARIVARQILYMEEYRELDAELLQSQDIARMIENEVEELGGWDHLPDGSVPEVVDRVILAHAQQMRDDGELKAEKYAALETRISELEGKTKTAGEDKDALEAELGVLAERVEQQDKQLTVVKRTVVTMVGIALPICSSLLSNWLGRRSILLVILAALVIGFIDHIARKVRLSNYWVPSVFIPYGLFIIAVIAEWVISPHLPRKAASFADNHFLWITGAIAAAISAAWTRKKPGVS